MSKDHRLLSCTEKLNLAAQTGLPVIIKGMPGEAKTAFINAIAEATKRHLETVIASIREASEIGGLPIDRPEGIVLHPPAWAVRLKNAIQGGILFLDEITCVMPSVQAALLRVILEKVVGDLALPKDTWMIAAANPPDIAANGWELSPPMANRFVHLDWELSTDVWISGMMSGFSAPQQKKLPANWREGIPQARALIATFIKMKPTSLRNLPKSESDRSGPWPSPRSWDMAATIYAAFEAAQEDPIQGVEACVGTAAARELASFLKNMDLPDPEELLAHPESIKWPDRDDIAFVMLASMTSAVLAKNTPQRWNSSLKVVSSAIGAGKTDLAIISAMTLLQENNKPKGAIIPALEIAAMFPMLQKSGIFEINARNSK
jgi:hypothetical protein